MTHPTRLVAALAILALGCGSKDKTDADATDVTEEEAVIDVVEETPCTSDDDCDNGLFCDGEETCDAGTCQPGTTVDCDDADPCTMDVCDETLGDCVNDPLDADGDGYMAVEAPTGESCGGNDCNDEADDIHPDAPETGCDLIDKDCDGENFEGIDDDEDGWIDFICDGLMTDHTGYEGFGDCDDDGDHLTGDFTEDPENIYPGAAEGCDGRIDHDCDGDATELDVDADHDGFAHPSCDPPEGEEDCDDDDDTVYPGAPEICDMVDNDCDGSWADGGADDDGDTYLDEDCGGDDCDDTSSLYNPGVTVECNTEDYDCNDHPDNDQDGDGSIRGADVGTLHDCGGTDCDDTLDTFHPGATLSCNTIDHDCNGHGDEDNDGDGHIREACSGGDDCDDTDATISPSGTVDCTTTDHDCNLRPDNDQDGDGYTRGPEVSGWTGCGGPDCNDADAAISPVGTVDCTTTDHDCNGNPDNDQDGDGSIRETVIGSWPACGGDDCDDDDATSHPGGTVDCSTTDHDCDGDPDNDQDGDGGIRESVTGSWPACGGNDCDDTNASIYWGATELCDTIDQDCDGDIVEGPGADDDGDGYLDITCGGPDCDDADDRIHPDPPAVVPDVCWRDDYDCDTILDDLATVPSVDIDVERGSAAEPAIAWSGTEYGIVWREVGSTGGDREIHFTRMDADGAEVGSPIELTSDTTNYYRPDIAWSGTKWGVVFQDDDSDLIYFLTMNSDGTGATAPVLATATCDTREQRPRIAGDGTGFGFVWTCYHSGTRMIYFDTGTAGGALGLGSPVNVVDNGSSLNTTANIAWQTSRYGVVWASRNGTGEDDIFLDIVDTTGVDLAGGEVNLTNLTPGSVQRTGFPSIVGGTVNVGAGDVPGFAIAWRHTGTTSMYGAVASLAEPPVATSGVRLSSAEVASAAYSQLEWIADGSSYGVAWQDGRSGYDVYLMQMGVDGTTTGYQEVVISDLDPAYNPGLAWRPSYLGVVWHNSSGDVFFSQPRCTY